MCLVEEKQVIAQLCSIATWSPVKKVGHLETKKTELSSRRPVFVSHVKPKVDVVAVVYSCYNNSSVSLNACYVCLFNGTVVTLVF